MSSRQIIQQFAVVGGTAGGWVLVAPAIFIAHGSRGTGMFSSPDFWNRMAVSLTTSVLVDKAALAGDSALQDLARLEQLAGAEALALTRELPAADAVRLHSVGVVLGSGSG